MAKRALPSSEMEALISICGYFFLRQKLFIADLLSPTHVKSYTLTTMIELAKTYDPKLAEADTYARWEAQGCFAPEINRDPSAPVYSIVIPPPNVTGNLHMGHALQHTIMDVLVRWKRMCGYRTLWLPGTDHAGISTQLMVTRQLEQEGLSRFDLGRERFVERVWQWKREYGGQITAQMRREGASVDWSRERFTMDEGLSNAVREAFVRLYEEGHIYRGNRIVNWCPKDQTVLSDLEVDKESFKGKLYFLQYPIKGSDAKITVATTRPETMLGDTAVAVNPNDERYKKLIGAIVLLPLVDREIPVIADEYVDPQFGTGAVKVTPAHDPNDYEMGLRHDLPQIVIMDKHARMTAAAGADFAGLDRYAAREKVIERFERLSLLEKSEDYEFAISRCNRCRTVIEPLISLQWFCRMDEMRDRALQLMKEDGLPRFTPAGYEKVYTEWLENLRDWTISRQLWWGHQIPAWYDAEGNVYVARNEAEARVKARAAGVADDEQLTQDPDVLDTWFSSALWPFSTLGWGHANSDDAPTRDLETFYPTSVLVTARDIIFLWVSRMVMMGLKFIGTTPFRDVFVTGTIFDKHGQRMSKTKGNGVDPLDVFDKYGVDATRLVLAAIGSTDTRWNDNQTESYRNFANKIWNAARFCLLNSAGARVLTDADLTRKNLPLHDRWILSRLNSTAQRVNAALALYDFHDAVQTLYHFFWDDFCDWYIELTKADVAANEATTERAAARSRLLTVLERALRLLHPFMPFITEELWRHLPQMRERGAQFFHPAYAPAAVEPTVMLTAFPQGEASLIDERAENEMSAVIDLITRVRNIRAEMNIKPSEPVRVIVNTSDAAVGQIFEANRAAIARLTRAAEIQIGERLETPRAAARAALTGGAEIAVPLEGLIDLARERERIARELEKLKNEAERLAVQLSNANFLERAPAEKINEAHARHANIMQRMKVLTQMLENLG